MSMSDPIADMLTRMRNAHLIGKACVSMPSSKMKVAIATLLLSEGYIKNFSTSSSGIKTVLRIFFKYHLGAPVMDVLQRISRPGLRVYKKKDFLPSVMNGLGIAVLSTSSGLMTDRKARSLGIGGEVIFYVA